VYTFGPTFRAENSHTNRHLSEFWMIEPEIAFADMDDLMELAESYLKFNLKYVLENNKDDLKFFDERVKKGLIEYLTNLLNSKFVRITYTEAISLLEKVDPAPSS
jgi:asparaginyl-tRNA synthetase